MGAGLTIPLSASADPPQFRIIDLHDSGVAANSIAYGINDIGEVVGDLQGVVKGAFVWLINDDYGLEGRTMLDLSDPEVIGGPSSAIARDINIYGMIIGNTVVPPFPSDVLLWDLVEKTVEDLSSSAHLDMKGNGYALTNTDPPTMVGWVNPSATPRRGFRYELNDVPVLLQPAEPAQFDSAETYDVSDTGEAVGWTTSGTPPIPDSCGDIQPPSTRWGTGPLGHAGITLTGIGSLPRGRFAYGINNNLDIVGESRQIIPACFRRGTIWPSGDYANPHPLPFISSPEHAFANAVSDRTNGDVDVVGRSEFSNAATLWRGTPGTISSWTAYDLNEISCGENLSPLAPLELREATDVNNIGWIVGRMVINPGTPQAATHAFLLVPNDWCPGDINAGAPDGVVNVQDLLALLGAFGNCDAESCCFEDIDGNGEVDVTDLLALLAQWGRCPNFDHLPAPEPFADVIVDKGLTMQNWDDFVDVMETGSSGDKANHLCWMQNYLMQCQFCPTCPNRDPYND